MVLCFGKITQPRHLSRAGQVTRPPPVLLTICDPVLEEELVT